MSFITRKLARSSPDLSSKHKIPAGMKIEFASETRTRIFEPTSGQRDYYRSYPSYQSDNLASPGPQKYLAEARWKQVFSMNQATLFRSKPVSFQTIHHVQPAGEQSKWFHHGKRWPMAVKGGTILARIHQVMIILHTASSTVSLFKVLGPKAIPMDRLELSESWPVVSFNVCRYCIISAGTRVDFGSI